MGETTDQTENQDIQREADAQAAKKKYLANPQLCPYCGSDDIYVDDDHEDVTPHYEAILRVGQNLEIIVCCTKCENHWHNFYEPKLVNVLIAGKYDSCC